MCEPHKHREYFDTHFCQLEELLMLVNSLYLMWHKRISVPVKEDRRSLQGDTNNPECEYDPISVFDLCFIIVILRFGTKIHTMYEWNISQLIKIYLSVHSRGHIM